MVKRLMIEKADRIYHLPPFLDEFLPRRDKSTLMGKNVIDLARFGWPLKNEATDAADSNPVTPELIQALQEKAAAWHHTRYGTNISPSKEIFIGKSIREILNLTALAFFNPGDVLLTPDPGVWHYRAATALASADNIRYNLTERNEFRPLPEAITENLSRLARGIFVTNPNNPTGSSVTEENLGQLLRLAGRENLLIILDQAFDNLSSEQDPASLFALPGGRKVALELYSFAYNCGWPGPSLGMAIGQATLINGLKRVAALFGQRFTAAEVGTALQAIESSSRNIKSLRVKLSANRNKMIELCRKIRLLPIDYNNGPFFWAKLPGRQQSRRYCRLLYMRSGIMAVPGIAFGENGEGFVRFSLLREEEIFDKALKAAERYRTLTRKKESQNG